MPKIKHGHCHKGNETPTYRAWVAMHDRCNRENWKGFHRYKGRGIKVCDRWKDFRNFLADMGERPTKKTLDRWPNPDGNYELGNCRWATWKEQNNNKTRVLRIHCNKGHKLEKSKRGWLFCRRCDNDKRNIRRRLNSL